MKVLLLSPPFREDYMRNARCDFVSLSHTQWYPILLGFSGALLEKHGHQVMLLDAPAAHLSLSQVEKAAREFRPDFLVVYGGRLSEENDQKIADRLTGLLHCRTVFCGPYVSIASRRWLEKTELVSGVVEGEFEYPLLELVEGKPEPEIRNLLYKKDGEIIRNPLRDYLDREALDDVPFVSEFFQRHLNFKNYRAISEPFPFMDMMTGRGCYWGICSFCLWVHSYIKGPVYNTRSLENVMEEIKYIKNHLPAVRSIMFQDDSLSEERAREISEALLARSGKISWSGYARADLPLEVLVLMKKSGCLNLHVGFESASNQVLKKAAKGITVERMTQFVSDARQAGLHIHGDFLMGLEGETSRSLLRTARWASSLDVDTAQFQVIIPFEGTPLYRSLAEKGWLKNGYPDYPGLPAEEIHRISRRAYRIFYLRPSQLVKILAHPRRRLWHYLKVANKVIPNIFFRRSP